MLICTIQTCRWDSIDDNNYDDGGGGVSERSLNTSSLQAVNM